MIQGASPDPPAFKQEMLQPVWQCTDQHCKSEWGGKLPTTGQLRITSSVDGTEGKSGSNIQLDQLNQVSGELCGIKLR